MFMFIGARMPFGSDDDAGIGCRRLELYHTQSSATRGWFLLAWRPSTATIAQHGQHGKNRHVL